MPPRTIISIIDSSSRTTYTCTLPEPLCAAFRLGVTLAYEILGRTPPTFEERPAAPI